MSYIPNQSLPHHYRPGECAEYTWSARFELPEPASLNTIVTEKLGHLVTYFHDPHLSVSGAVIRPGQSESTVRTSVILGLDPSQRFGTPSITACQIIAQGITSQFDWQRVPQAMPEMRVIMGRRVGYDDNPTEYSVDDVAEGLITNGCQSIKLTDADLFSLRHLPDNRLRSYTEPGVIIEAQAADLTKILATAEHLGQQRLVPEITNIITQVYQQERSSHGNNSYL